MSKTPEIIHEDGSHGAEATPEKRMSTADLAFLDLVGGPARFTVEQVAVKLNFRVHDIPILMSKKHLKPLGNPPQSGVKYFATVIIMQYASDPVWLSKATNIIYEHWKEENEKKKERANGTATH